MAAHSFAPVCLEREFLLDPSRSMAAEWKLTNGLEGYAAGTAAGINTSSAHGLLVVDGRVLVAKLDEELELDDGERIALSTNEYHDGTLHPTGYLHLEAMCADEGRIGWQWRARGVEIEKVVAVVPGYNRTVVRYRLLSSPGPVRMRLAPFVADRPVDRCRRGEPESRCEVEERQQGAVVRTRPDSRPIGVFGWSGSAARGTPGRFVETGLWYWRFLHRDDREAGREHVEDLYTPGLMVFELMPGDSLWVTLTAERRDVEQPDRLDPEADLILATRGPDVAEPEQGPAPIAAPSTQERSAVLT